MSIQFESQLNLRITGREPEPGVFGSLEPERLEKKTGAEAALKKSHESEPLKKPAPQPCEKIKSIRKYYFSYSSLGR